jgi:hypothetical protein
MEKDLVPVTLRSSEYPKTDKTQNPNNPNCYTQTSEPFRIFEKRRRRYTLFLQEHSKLKNRYNVHYINKVLSRKPRIRPRDLSL